MTHHATTMLLSRTPASGSYVAGKSGYIPASVGGERAARDGWRVNVTALPTPSAFVAA